MGFGKQELAELSAIVLLLLTFAEKINNKLVNTIKKIRSKWREL